MAIEFDNNRTNLAGFDVYYESEIAPQLASGGKRHRTLKRRQTHILLAGALAIVATILGSLSTRIITIDDPLDFMGLIFFSLFGMIVIFAFSSGNLSNSSEKIDELITKSVCRFLRFHHKTNAADFPFSVFLETHIVPFHDEVELRDRIAGRHQGTDFVFCQCTLTRTGGDETTVIFRGVLLLARFHKPFKGKTIIKRNRGPMINSFRPTGNLERVSLEHPAFEEEFATYGTDQLESRYILTPRFMERVMALIDIWNKGSIEAAFVRGQVLLSMNFGVDPEQVSHDFLAADDPQRTQEVLDRICIAIDAIDTLQLNSRTTA